MMGLGSGHRVLLSAGCVTLALNVLGCAGDKDQANRRLRALEDKLMRLQNETDQLREQVVGLEHRPGNGRAADAAYDPTPGGAPATLERPKLKLIRLQPQDDPPSLPSSATDAPGPSGDSVESKAAEAVAGTDTEDSAELDSDTAPRPVIKVRGDDVLSAADSPTGATP